MPDTPEETAARGRVAAAQEIASEASRLLYWLRGICAESNTLVPSEFDQQFQAWLRKAPADTAKHAGAK